jgi:hypothetical protein
MNEDKIRFNPDFVGPGVFECAQPSVAVLAPCADTGSTAPTARGRKRNHPIPFSLPWAAGFTDGEGCIFIFKQVYTNSPGRNPTYRLGFSITQNNLPVLEHFLRGLGVHGKIYGSTRTLGHNRQLYELKYTGVNALKVIGALQPHLIRKQQEAQTALNYWRLAHGGKRPGPAGWPPSVLGARERYYKKLKSLK